MRRGFTLIELLIALAIVAVLAGMFTALLGIANRQAKRTNTEATMRKVAAAIRMFQRDNGVLPYQARYPVPGAGASVALVAGWNDYPGTVSREQPFPNLLFRRLGRSMDQAERDALNAAAAAAAGKYHYYAKLFQADAGMIETGSDLAYRTAYLLPSTQVHAGRGNDTVATSRYASYLNRAGADRARRAVSAGALDLDGPIIVGPTSTAPHKDLTATPLLAPAEIGGMATGWCDDYLDGSLSAKDRAGDAVLDAWGNPLVYVGMVIPRTRSSSAQIYNTEVKSQDLVWYGMGATGFRANSGPWAEVVAARRWRLLQNGRITVGANAIDNQPAPLCTGNPGAAMDSDRRWFAAPGFELDCELWSAGPDGRLEWVRSAAANRDNVPLLPYDRSLR